MDKIAAARLDGMLIAARGQIAAIMTSTRISIRSRKPDSALRISEAASCVRTMIPGPRPTDKSARWFSYRCRLSSMCFGY